MIYDLKRQGLAISAVARKTVRKYLKLVVHRPRTCSTVRKRSV